jgi:hypothetical protein
VAEGGLARVMRGLRQLCVVNMTGADNRGFTIAAPRLRDLEIVANGA